MSEASYRKALRAAVYGLWLGVIDLSQWWDTWLAAVTRGLTQAWTAGARECGIEPEEWSSEEKSELDKAIRYELSWVDRFGEHVIANSKAKGGKRGPLYSRLEPYVGRWEGIRSQARAMACKDEKLEWVLGPTEKSCASCSKLDGKVKRASYWYGQGILPRVHGVAYLTCQGFNCRCELLPTDKPMSRGPLPRLP